MKKAPQKLFSLSIAAIAIAVLAPPVRGQASSITTITTLPTGGGFTVDGTAYQTQASFLWPAGSAHVLQVLPLLQYPDNNGKQLTFSNWQWAGGILTGNRVVVTADPSISSYQALFQAQYALKLIFFNCGGAGPCSGPGVVYVDGSPFTSDQVIYEPAGGSSVVQAFPNPGYVFAGWAGAGPGQLVQGFQNTVTMSGPQSVYPTFAATRGVNLVTTPPGLQVTADHVPVITPAQMSWGVNTMHAVGPVSPQLDSQGNAWIFSSWSDGGPALHAYTMLAGGQPDTLTAAYVPGVSTSFNTSPAGLNLTVDGSSGSVPLNYTWGAGETHSIQAPAQQTDSTGHVWAFSKWSNGGPASQTIVVPISADGQGMTFLATYQPMGHLTVNSTVSGLAVTVNGSACPVPCDLKQAVGTQVDVAAPASLPIGAGSRQDFLGWTGGASGGPGDLILTLGADPVAVTANYHVMNHLATSSNPASGASWSFQPGSPDGFYDAQSSVNVGVTPLSGYRFRNWTGDLSGSIPSGSVAMSAPRAVQAILDKIPFVPPTGVGNGAGGTPQTGVAAGSVVSVFGMNLTSGTATAPGGVLLPQTLGGVTVQFAGRLMPLFFVSPNQINLQLPPDAPPGAQTLTISSLGQADVQASFTVVQDAPGLFQNTLNGQLYALAAHADGSAVTSASPAIIGELLTVYGTGFGPTNPARPEGFPAPQAPLCIVQDALSISAGPDTLPAVNAFATPGSVGIDSVQFRLTDTALSGTNAPLSVTIGGQQSNTVILPVQ